MVVARRQAAVSAVRFLTCRRGKPLIYNKKPGIYLLQYVDNMNSIIPRNFQEFSKRLFLDDQETPEK